MDESQVKRLQALASELRARVSGANDPITALAMVAVEAKQRGRAIAPDVDPFILGWMLLAMMMGGP